MQGLLGLLNFRSQPRNKVSAGISLWPSTMPHDMGSSDFRTQSGV